MPRIQVEQLIKNLRDLTVIKKLNEEGYSFNQRHVSSIPKDLSPEELESLLRKRYSYSKGQPFFKVLVRDLKSFKKKYWF